MITLHKGQYLSDVMDEIPSNCILSKRIPGCGATTLELETQRNLLGVYEDVTTDKIRNYLTNNRLHKIMTTPESFGKVKTACSGIDIHNHFFLLMDECHQLIKDVDYRTDIVLPMNDFFRFKGKALVSATPIGFSDPRFKEFETVEVSADYDYRQEITATHTYNINKAISEYLEKHKEGTVCFFVNSVAMIYSIMKQFDILEDSTVYCAPKSRLKLKNEYSFDNAYNDWSADTMKKYNFFTGRFFTAFDLDLPYQPDLVMVTDPYISEYTILDIDTDCIQICGRFRNGIKSATHIYRVNPEMVIQSKEQIEKQISLDELGFFYDGAGIDICDINKNGTPDLLMMVYDAPEGENSFRYQIAFDLQSNGNYLSLSPVYEVPGLGHDGDGAGVAVGDIDNNGTLDILFMALDAPSGKDKFVYEILPDIDKYGNSYAKPIYTPRFPDSLSPCDTGQGAACCLYDLDNNGFLDAIFVAIENIKGKSNSWKYVTGHNLNKQGVPMC